MSRNGQKWPKIPKVTQNDPKIFTDPGTSKKTILYKREFFDVNRQKKCFIIYGELLDSSTVDQTIIKHALDGDTKARNLLFEQENSQNELIFNNQTVSDANEQPMILDLSKPGFYQSASGYIFPQIINSTVGQSLNTVYQPNLQQDMATQGEIKSSLQQTVPHTSQLTVNPEEFGVLKTAAQVRNWGGYMVVLGKMSLK